MARPLKIFMRGKSVGVLQALLRSMGHTLDDRPNLFGASTRDAVKEFQRQRGLKVSGQVDGSLLEIMQQGSNVAPENQDKKEATSVEATPEVVTKKQWDALVALLIRKGIFEKQELENELAALSLQRPKQIDP